MAKRKRRFGSLATELVGKAREAMLTAVQIFNNPQIEFKSELFIVTTVIAWTYLLHAYYRRQGIEYRKFEMAGSRRKFERTRYGAFWYWNLGECLDCKDCPLPEPVKKNLRFLIGVRNEIEHQMTTRIDDHLSAKFQAAALNFNQHIKKLFGARYSLDPEQAMSIQFSSITEKTAKELMAQADLPQHIHSYIVQFEGEMTEEEYNDPAFSYRVAFVRKTANAKTAADKVIDFVPPDSGTEVEMNRVFLKDTEKTKYLPSTVVKQMVAEGYPKFTMKHHTDLWKAKTAKDPKHGYGVQIEKNWFWYEKWMAVVRKHCHANASLYQGMAETTPPAKKSA